MDLAILSKFSKYQNWVSLVGSLVMVRLVFQEACQLQRFIKELQKKNN